MCSALGLVQPSCFASCNSYITYRSVVRPQVTHILLLSLCAANLTANRCALPESDSVCMLQGRRLSHRLTWRLGVLLLGTLPASGWLPVPCVWCCRAGGRCPRRSRRGAAAGGGAKGRSPNPCLDGAHLRTADSVWPGPPAAGDPCMKGCRWSTQMHVHHCTERTGGP